MRTEGKYLIERFTKRYGLTIEAVDSDAPTFGVDTRYSEMIIRGPKGSITQDGNRLEILVVDDLEDDDESPLPTFDPMNPGEVIAALKAIGLHDAAGGYLTKLSKQTESKFLTLFKKDKPTFIGFLKQDDKGTECVAGIEFVGHYRCSFRSGFSGPINGMPVPVRFALLKKGEAQPGTVLVGQFNLQSLSFEHPAEQVPGVELTTKDTPTRLRVYLTVHSQNGKRKTGVSNHNNQCPELDWLLGEDCEFDLESLAPERAKQVREKVRILLHQALDSNDTGPLLQAIAAIRELLAAWGSVEYSEEMGDSHQECWSKNNRLAALMKG